MAFQYHPRVQTTPQKGLRLRSRFSLTPALRLLGRGGQDGPLLGPEAALANSAAPALEAYLHINVHKHKPLLRQGDASQATDSERRATAFDTPPPNSRPPTGAAPPSQPLSSWPRPKLSCIMSPKGRPADKESARGGSPDCFRQNGIPSNWSLSLNSLELKETHLPSC